MTEPTPESPDVDAMIDELAARSAELSKLLHDTVVTLNALLAERSAPDAAGSDGKAATGRDALARDVLEIAVRQARAAGLSVEDYLREAVLAHAARTADGDTGSRGGYFQARGAS